MAPGASKWSDAVTGRFVTSSLLHCVTRGGVSMNSMMKKLACWLAPAMLACGAVAQAQDKPAGYPLRPIRIIITVAPGAGADFMARSAAQLLTDRWGQNAVIDSRPGGGGVVGLEVAARAAPDGYTILQYGDAMLLMAAQKRVPFDVFRT